DNDAALSMSGERKNLLLTGASRGIGHATVRRFSDAGWNIVTVSREAVPEECKRDPNWSHHITADLAEPADVETVIREAVVALGDGGLDALVNNAGMSPKAPFKERLGTLNGDLAEWRRVFELNFFAPLALARGHAGHPFAGSAYSTSKAALSALTREMAAEFAELGVRVNAVAPGEIATQMLSPETEVLLPRIPLHRLGTPEDVAATIFYLCADDAAYITGTEIFVTGGQHLY